MSESNQLDRVVMLRDVIALLSRADLGYLKGDKLIGKIKPAHGPCCCCMDCGQFHDDCVCLHNELLSEILKLPDAI